MKTVAVIGSGSWGTALAVQLVRAGNKVILWSFKQEEAESLEKNRENLEFLPGIKLPEAINITYKDEDVESADMFVLATPSKFVRNMITRFKPYIGEGKIVVNVAKGLEESTLLRLSEVIKEVAPMAKVAVLSGPSHAEEVGKDMATAIVAASEDIEVARTVQACFMTTMFRVYTSTDIIGVEFGGALKNLIALAAGISDGVGYGDNTKAALMTRGIAEISRLGVAMGADEKTFAGLSGIGDLIVTCTSMHSRNRRAGILLGQGKTLKETLDEVHMVVEGVSNAKAAYEMSKKYGINMPITSEINDVLYNGKDVKAAVVDLMTRGKSDE